MAFIEKRGPYQWRVKIRKKGFASLTKTFSDKKNAETWARKTESEMERGIFISSSAAEQTSVAEILDRYEKEVFPRLADGGKRERFRLALLKKKLGHLSVAALRSNHVAAYRDQRLKEVSSQSVKHELGLLNRVLKSAQIDGGIHLPHGLPTAQVRMPKLPCGRDRRLREGEEQRLIDAAVASKAKEIKGIILLALETAARRGEIAAMRWEHVDLENGTWKILYSKKGPRTVPLSPKAKALLERLPRRIDGSVWGVQDDSITQAFGRVCQQAGIEDLRFHDLRHEATSRLFEKPGWGIMEVASVTGHKTLTMLKRYTHLRAEDLAAKMG